MEFGSENVIGHNKGSEEEEVSCSYSIIKKLKKELAEAKSENDWLWKEVDETLEIAEEKEKELSIMRQSIAIEDQDKKKLITRLNYMRKQLNREELKCEKYRQKWISELRRQIEKCSQSLEDAAKAQQTLLLEDFHRIDIIFSGSGTDEKLEKKMKLLQRAKRNIFSQKTDSEALLDSEGKIARLELEAAGKCQNKGEDSEIELKLCIEHLNVVEKTRFSQEEVFAEIINFIERKEAEINEQKKDLLLHVLKRAGAQSTNKITQNSRVIIKDQGSTSNQKTGKKMTLLAGVQLEKFDKSKADASEVLAGKVVGFYFSAHWCPPCRAFTPILKDFYGEVEDDFEVVFVSLDRSENDLKSYMKECHGDWYHIPYGSDVIKELSTKYGVSGIPALIIVKPDGTEVTKDGRNDVQNGKSPKATINKWKA